MVAPRRPCAQWEAIMPRATKPKVKLKRAYDPPANADGCRVLVDRVWPRGVSKDELRLDEWPKNVAPSTALRKWFDHVPAKWAAFKKRYFVELEERADAVDALRAKMRRGTVTLVFAAKDTPYNNAVALKEYLERHAAD
jgi:uncharacterized protein YeaO (DUF488 family)